MQAPPAAAAAACKLLRRRRQRRTPPHWPLGLEQLPWGCQSLGTALVPRPVVASGPHTHTYLKQELYFGSTLFKEALPLQKKWLRAAQTRVAVAFY